jgi:hypothetical protein
MFRKKIIALEEKKKLRKIDLSMVHDIGADPMTAEMYKNDLMVEIMHIDNEINYERSMKPIRYAALIFSVVSAGLLLFIVLSEIL